MKRIFYFNITYTCNSNCIFCYSHNTIHSGKFFKEISVDQFVKYLCDNNVSTGDRIIINGGEPFLHSTIIDLLKVIKDFGCETLIYTNGRNLDENNLSFIDGQFRFIIPIHGYPKLHDLITRVEGSFANTLAGLEYIKTLGCLIDAKIIINHYMAENDAELEKTLSVFENLPINNAVHITKMADTIVSQRNKCKSITQQQAQYCTKKIFDFFVDRGLKIKIFDTCVKAIDISRFKFDSVCEEAQVFFMDNDHKWKFECYTPYLECRSQCDKQHICFSAVGNYHVLEYDNGLFYRRFE